MRLMVTGGAGFIGSAVVRQAIIAGHDVLSLDALTYAGNLHNLAAVADAPNHTFHWGDICDATALPPLFDCFQPDAVMHLAAESHVDRSITGPAHFLETNITGTFHLLEAARTYWTGTGQPGEFRFHHISTDEVFGALTLDPRQVFTENTPYSPRSPYAASKAASDHLVRAWHHTYGLPVVISNCSNNYGPHQHPEKLIPLVITRALAGDPIPIYGTGQNVRDWLYVEDHARALLDVVSLGTPGANYAIGGRSEMTNLNIVHKICALLDAKHPKTRPYADQITFVTDRLGHDLRYAIDPSHIEQTLGWRAQVSLDEGLEHTIDWIMAHQGLTPMGQAA